MKKLGQEQEQQGGERSIFSLPLPVLLIFVLIPLSLQALALDLYDRKKAAPSKKYCEKISIKKKKSAHRSGNAKQIECKTS